MKSESQAVSKRDVAWATVIAVATLAFFIATLRPGVGGTEDSPKFQFVGEALGTAHSPGYPFYVMATWLFTRLPLSTLAYEVNLFSAVCGALACLCVFLTARRLGVTRPLSLAAALGAATSYPVWSNSVTAEVYTLAAVLSGFAVYWVIAFAQTGTPWRLYAACAMWAMGFGNHLTIAGILPAALVYGVYKDRSVLKPRIAITAAIIGIMGVLQYWFIAIRTMQGAPYLEARADTIMGVFDIIIARDVSWARFYQAQSSVAAIEVPMLINGIRIHMGTIPLLMVAVAIVIGIRRRNAEVLVILGAAAGTLAFIANLWGDVVGFITPVCVQLWPLAALGVQWVVTEGQQAIRPSGHQGIRANTTLGLTAAAALSMIVPAEHLYNNNPKIAALRTPGEGPGVQALYASLSNRSAIVAENYWLARLVNYMHYSGEVRPDPNPRVLDNDVNEVRTAVADGLEVYAFEGATHWLNAQGMRFEPTTVARQPFMPWLDAQARGTVFVAVAAGRAVPFEWQPASAATQRPANYTVLVRTSGEPAQTFEQNDAGVEINLAAPGGRSLNAKANDEGLRILWGDDVAVSADRGIAAAAFTPDGKLLGQWTFDVAETPGVQLPPTPFILRGERSCEVLRPGQPHDVSRILADGIWLATTEGTGKAVIKIDAPGDTNEWRLRLSSGRGEAVIENSQLIMTPTLTTRPVFRLAMPPAPSPAIATLQPGDITAVRVCQAEIPALPATGALEVTAERDGFFGAGWHLGERGGSQRFRWSQRISTLQWRMDHLAPMRMILRVRPASAKGATLHAAANGVPLASCTLEAGKWTDCTVSLPETATRTGINQLTLSADTISPATDHPGDPRELSFVMQASRVRVGS